MTELHSFELQPSLLEDRWKKKNILIKVGIVYFVQTQVHLSKYSRQYLSGAILNVFVHVKNAIVWAAVYVPIVP